MDNPRPSLLDTIIEKLCLWAASIGLPGNRWLWRYKNKQAKKQYDKESRGQASTSPRPNHKMCPHCRALVESKRSHCTECGETLNQVINPGASRLKPSLLPRDISVVSILALCFTLVFALMLMWSIRQDLGGGILGMDSRALSLFGMTWLNRIQIYGQWWTLITAMFLHGGLIHIGFNTMALIRLGPFVEIEIGGARLWVIFFFSGLIGNLLHVYLHGAGAPVVGASGGILGLVGFLFAYSSRIKTRGARFLRNRMIEILFLMLLISFLPMISFWAHTGGTLMGMVFGALLPKGEARNDPRSLPWNLAAWLCTILTVASFTLVALNA